MRFGSYRRRLTIIHLPHSLDVLVDETSDVFVDRRPDQIMEINIDKTIPPQNRVGRRDWLGGCKIAALMRRWVYYLCPSCDGASVPCASTLVIGHTLFEILPSSVPKLLQPPHFH